MKVESLVDSGIDYIVNENYALERRPNGFCLNFYISLFAVNNKIVVFTDIKKMDSFIKDGLTCLCYRVTNKPSSGVGDLKFPFAFDKLKVSAIKKSSSTEIDFSKVKLNITFGMSNDISNHKVAYKLYGIK